MQVKAYAARSAAEPLSPITIERRPPGRRTWPSKFRTAVFAIRTCTPQEATNGLESSFRRFPDMRSSAA
jgi:hypothetical protein